MRNSKKLSKINQSLKRIKDSVIRERLLIVKEYYQGKTCAIVANHHKCSPAKVVYWKQRYDNQGLKGLQTKRRSGRPPKLNLNKAKEIKKQIIRQTSTDGGWQTEQIKEYIQKQAGVSYSSRHIIRIAQNWGLSKITPRPQYAYARKKDKEVFLKGKH
jgi:transposase